MSSILRYPSQDDYFKKQGFVISTFPELAEVSVVGDADCLPAFTGLPALKREGLVSETGTCDLYVGERFVFCKMYDPSGAFVEQRGFAYNRDVMLWVDDYEATLDTIKSEVFQDMV